MVNQSDSFGQSLSRIRQTLLALEQPVTRKQYLVYGLVLAAIKYFLEFGCYYLATDQFFLPTQFLIPLFSERFPLWQSSPDWFAPLVIILNLPFILFGISMSIRRATDADLSSWWGLLFFVPLANLMIIATLCILPSRPHSQAQNQRSYSPHQLIYPFLVTFGLGLAGILVVFVLANLFGTYGTSLFLLSPFLMGCIPGYLFESRLKMPVKSILGYVTFAGLMVMGGLMLLALEGAICIIMAAPLIFGMAYIGAICGHAVARNHKSGPSIAPSLMILMIPIAPIVDYSLVKSHEDTVITEITIDAPIEKVWQNVVAFSDLPKSEHWLFKLGIASPLRATIDGEGVGAIRYCQFTTGSFVEPITAWDAPIHLAFDVKEQPIPMKELSWRDQVHAPHLYGFFRSKRGEFRLSQIGPQQTKLQGQTWYQTDIHPGWYWQIYGRWFIHVIHTKVLDHISNLSTS